MKSPVKCIFSLLILAVLLAACDFTTAPPPTSTAIPPTATQTSTPTSTPLPPTSTATQTQTSTSTPRPTPLQSKPSSSPAPTHTVVPINTLAVSPTPVPGWTTFTNEFLGYSLNYPVEGEIYKEGANGMDMNEVIPPGFTSDEYFHYVLEILPDMLCVMVSVPGASITISAPYDPLGSYSSPCPGMGIGSDYRMEGASETWFMAGKEYKDIQGTKLYLKSTNAFYGEFYVFELQNGFRVVYNGGPRDGGMSYDAYLIQRSVAREILATLHWFRDPYLTKPGTTCAGKLTHLMPTVQAVVVDRGTPADVRSEPSAGGNVTAQLNAGTIVKIMEGPVCADGLVFWKVNNETLPGGSGWIIEWDGTNYWLEPYKP
jgi:hypothetical protein